MTALVPSVSMCSHHGPASALPHGDCGVLTCRMWRPQNLYIITGTAVVFLLFLGTFFLVRTGLPSADVVFETAASRPVINVSDFDPGDVEILLLNDRRVIVWRRSEADQALAESQNTSEAWRHQTSTVSGQAAAVFADDANLTLDGEWFFALAEFSNQFQYLSLRAGKFEGFFEGRYAAHFDLAGRIRKGGGSTNLTVIEAEYVDDGQRIRLYLDGEL
ncbi:MAG: hypothetical protein AAFU80_23510 [Pseudomonadota bacterium]